MTGRDGGELGFGGRDRFRRDRDNQYHYQSNSRFEEKNNYNPMRSGRSGNRSGGFGGKSSGNSLPSRHLWVGNLPHGIPESEFAQHFLRFGPLESVAFQPGRSYAFVNFTREEDAEDALEALRGFPVAGNPLRIEFAKADKSLGPSHDQDHLQSRDDRYPGLRESSYLQKEFRTRHASDGHSYTENYKTSDKNAEPSAVLWVGFPASLNVDDMVLRRAFSPFGAIEKITAFPGRSYAFVRFESITSACKAKDTLHGKLFGNPRVHICFAKNESGATNSERNLTNVPPSPHYRYSGRQGSSENFRQDRKFANFADDPRIRSPRLFQNLGSGDSDPYSRKGTVWTGGNDPFEQGRFEEVGSELGPPHDMYEHQSSPIRGKRGHSHDFSPRFPQTSTFHEEPWNFSEDVHFSHGPKRIKTNSFHPDKELPEYPCSDRELEKCGFPHHLSGLSQADRSHRQFNGPFGHNKHISDVPLDIAPPQREWRGPHDSLQIGSGSTLLNAFERRRLTPDSDNPSVNEWKWEGVIAKGGTPVCRARCFPVGKVLDTELPEFLDCTARTGLDMLSKHYYQATNAWVVFFVPGSDADIGFYNEFMNYLEEKQRAAVSKLDENTTLFLVPPSNFSEKVLKVPGKLSISGVILRLENPGSNVPPFHRQPQNEDATVSSFPGNTSYPKPLSPSRSIPSYVPDFNSNSPRVGGRSDNFDNSRHEYPLHGNPRAVPNWPSSHLQISVSDTRIPQSQAPSSLVNSMVQQNSSVMTRPMQETSSGYSTGGTSGVGGLQPEQLVQLASTLLGKPRQSDNIPSVSTGHDLRQASAANESDQVQRTSQNLNLNNNQVNSESSRSQFSQAQQSQMTANDNQTRADGNQPLQNAPPPEVDSDPQHRLQATLQLAAALLQQIQQGKGS